MIIRSRVNKDLARTTVDTRLSSIHRYTCTAVLTLLYSVMCTATIDKYIGAYVQLYWSGYINRKWVQHADRIDRIRSNIVGKFHEFVGSLGLYERGPNEVKVYLFTCVYLLVSACFIFACCCSKLGSSTWTGE